MVQTEGHSGSAQPGGPRGACGCLSYISGIFQYETISCINCTDSRVVCFGYYCKYALATYPTAPGSWALGIPHQQALCSPRSSTQWQSAVQGLLSYM